MTSEVTQAESAIFIQKTPLESFRLLTCTAAGDITFPQGDVTIQYLPSSEYGRWVRAAIVQGEGGAVTGSLERVLKRTADVLLTAQCPFAALAINFSCSGPRSSWGNFDVRLYLTQVYVTSRRLGAPVSLTPTTDFVRHSLDISALDAFWYIPPTRSAYVNELISTGNITDIAPRSSQCGGRCANAVAPAERVYVAAGTPTVYRTSNGGVSWDTITAPFAVQSLLVLPENGDVIVAGSTALTGEPATIAVSSNGVDWYIVELTTPNEVAVRQLVMDAMGDVYAVAGTSIFRSANRGSSWHPVVTTPSGTFSDISLRGQYGYAVGNGVLYYRSGITWVPVSTTDNLAYVDINAHGHGIAVDTTGGIYRIWNGEVARIASTISAAPTSLRFDSSGYIGIVTFQSATFITDDAGVTWSRYDTIGGRLAVPISVASWLVASDTSIFRFAMPEEM